MLGLQPNWLEELDQTADAGIIVRAGDLPKLFVRAAWGMPAEPRRVTLQAAEREDVGDLPDVTRLDFELPDAGQIRLE
jgi:hypothetical protein